MAKVIYTPPARVWFTGDTHFGHGKMVEPRGYKTVEDMDRGLVAAWNNVVSPGDEVFHLGDFAYKSSLERTISIFAALNGKKHLVLGNHDVDEEVTLGLAWASPPAHRRFLRIGQQKLVLDHYAGRTWAGSFRGAIQLFGHSHGRMPANSQSCDVGVDAWAGEPVGLDDIVAYLALQLPFHNEDSGDEFDGGFRP